MTVPQEVHVKVVIDNPTTNPPQFHFETTDLPMGPNNVLYFRNLKKNQGFYVHYDLQGATGFHFPTNLDEALWVEAGSLTNCPDEARYWRPFEAWNVLNGGRTLVVWNKNRSEAKFAYTLRITNGIGWLRLDPGGENQNRGIDFQSYLLLTGGATGAIAGIAASALTSSAFIAQDALTYGIGGALIGLIVGFILARL